LGLAKGLSLLSAESVDLVIDNFLPAAGLISAILETLVGKRSIEGGNYLFLKSGEEAKEARIFYFAWNH
jgi:hypothetical protein